MGNQTKRIIRTKKYVAEVPFERLDSALSATKQSDPPFSDPMRCGKTRVEDDALKSDGAAYTRR